MKNLGRTHHCYVITVAGKGPYKGDWWFAGSGDKDDDNKKVNAIAQPTALQIKDIKDAVGRLELAAGMSDSGTIVSSSSGSAVRSFLKQKFYTLAGVSVLR